MKERKELNTDILRFLNETLPFVKKPGRYIGGEYNSVLKDSNGLLRGALIFPDVYEVGMSNYGLEILYHLLNSLEFVFVERAYLPWPDMIERMKKCSIPLFTLETKTPLKDLHFIGISLEYELSYTNVVEVLKLSAIPVRATERGEDHPIIIGGGPLAYNPEPISQAFDVIFVGDGEEGVLEIAEVLYETKDEKRESKIKELSKIEGVYVPGFYEQKRSRIIPVNESYPKIIKKRILKDLDTFKPVTRKILPHVESVHDRGVIEIMRGCTRGCRFCHAGMVYRPVRERKDSVVLKSTAELLENTGYEELSLLSLSTMDYSAIARLTDDLMCELKKQLVALSLPSTRVDSFGVDIAGKIAGIRKTGLTFAPETGSQRLRNVINKQISDDDIYAAVFKAYKMGWQRVKLYFMIGLPGETEEDLNETVKMIRRIKNIGFREVRVSVSIFVPKPHTPFQYSKLITPKEAFEKIRFLKRARKFAKVDFHDPHKSFIEGVLSRGGRELFSVILKANELGQIYDEWTESFNYENWEKAFEFCGIDIDKYTGPYDKDDEFPWDHIWAGVDREFLWKEYEKSLRGEITQDCRWEKCTLCGVCIKGGVMNILKTDIDE